MAKSSKPGAKKAAKKKSSSLRSLDIRKQKYVANRLAGKSKKASALEAGYSEAMAENAAAKIESTDVRRAFQELARKAVPAEKIIKRLREGLDATWKHQDNKRRTVTEPYFRERREYLVLAAKLGGYYVEQRQIDAEVKTADATRERVRALVNRIIEAKVQERLRTGAAEPATPHVKNPAEDGTGSGEEQ